MLSKLSSAGFETGVSFDEALPELRLLLDNELSSVKSNFANAFLLTTCFERCERRGVCKTLHTETNTPFCLGPLNPARYGRSTLLRKTSRSRQQTNTSRLKVPPTRARFTSCLLSGSLLPNQLCRVGIRNPLVSLVSLFN